MTPLLQDTVAAQAARRPDATALVMGEWMLTYGELEERSNRLAQLLVEEGCRPGDRICLFVPKKPEAIVGMLAALKARCSYVPIDLASPAPRVQMIVDAAQPRLALAMDEAVALIRRPTRKRRRLAAGMGIASPRGARRRAVPYRIHAGGRGLALRGASK